jgi:perosamine synthetase
MAALALRGVGTRPFFLGLHEQPVFHSKGWYLNERYPVTERAARQGFYLPSSVTLTESDINFVVEQLAEALSKE